jgi:hypothetical protein
VAARGQTSGEAAVRDAATAAFAAFRTAAFSVVWFESSDPGQAIAELA